MQKAFRIALTAAAPHKTRMFLLGGSDFPNDSATLHAALSESLAPLGLDATAVVLDGAFPSFAAMRVDLTGALFHRGYRMPGASSPGKDGFFSRAIEIKASPAKFESLPFNVSFRADDCVFAFGNTAEGVRVGILQRCSGGTLEVAIRVADIEASLLTIANEAASGFGASVQSVRIVLDAESPRRVAITATTVAKALMTKATLTLRGRLEVDDGFNARLSDITCTGDGMIANLAASQLRPRLAEWERVSFSLANALPEGLAISDIALDAGPELRARAGFHFAGAESQRPGVAKE